MNFTFLHCADLHLGSPLTGLALKDENVAGKFAAAGREAFSDLVTLAIKEAVAFVLIAGDIYDGDWSDNSIGLFFNREAGRLARANIPVYLIKGNHDAASVVTKTIPLPDNIIEFSTRAAQTREIAGLRVAVHGRSFPDRAVTENWAVAYPPPKPGWFNIGMLHTSCEGNALHATYAPCSVAELVSRGYDYWALGHIHQHQVLNRDPWIVYPGNIQGRSVRECGEKGAVLVDVADGRVVDARRVIVDRARWIEAIIDVAKAESADAVSDIIRAAMRGNLGGVNGKMVALRARLVGETAMNGELRSRRARWADDTQAFAQHVIEDVWLEKLSLETREPGAARRPDLGGIDLRSMLDDCADDADFRRKAAEAIALIGAKLPGDAQGDDGPLADDLDALIAEAAAIVRARADGAETGR